MRRSFALSCLPLAALVGFTAFAQPTPAVPTASIDRSQDIVCRKDKETGSLVKAKKTCHSRAQWLYIDDTNQQFSRQMADDARTRSGGN